MIEIIPAIDMIGGKCVRLTQGDYAQKSTYYDDPLDAAKNYEAIGVRRLHLVDLDGAKAARPVNLKVLERIASATSLDVQFGGGIKSGESLEAVFSAGAGRAICGSIAVTDPDTVCGWIGKYGSRRIVLGADVRDGFVATHGWLEASSLSASELIDRFTGAGLSQVICTDISRDGMLQGPSFGLYADLQGAYPAVDITVSGGISAMADIERLDGMGLRSVIVGKAIYEGRITLEEIQGWLQRE